MAMDSKPKQVVLSRQRGPHDYLRMRGKKIKLLMLGTILIGQLSFGLFQKEEQLAAGQQRRMSYVSEITKNKPSKRPDVILTVTVYLTSSGSLNRDATLPGWNPSSNYVDAIGGGGGGGGAGAYGYGGGGGGGGGWVRYTNHPDLPATVGFTVGGGGGSNGAGGSTNFNGTTNVTGGGPGAYGGMPGAIAGGGGGVGNAGSVGYTGGTGGTGSNYGVGGGGGGAAGPSGNGYGGGASSGYSGGTGGTSNGGAGGGGAGAGGGGANEYGNGVGSGSGGGGGSNPGGPGNGGNYGGGGGGQGSNAPYQGGSGYQGVIIIVYNALPTPVVSSISPNSGPTAGGQAVTISGSGFYNVTAANIGGAPITNIGVPHQGAITGYTSAGGAGGPYHVTVNVSGGVAAGIGYNLYYYVSPPSVSSCSPASGPTGGGNYVIVNGANMGGVSVVRFNGVDATSVSVIDANRVQCYPPAGGAGAASVAVYNGYGGGAATVYTYVVPPSLSSAAPSSGPTNVETLVAITGSNMGGVNSVTFGGSPVVTGIDSSNPNLLYCWAPVHAAGLVNVVISNAYGSANGNIFTYVTPPSLSAVASPVPAIGLIFGGTAITLTGANLAGTTSVMIGGVAATNLVVVNANTITCRTPPHAKGVVSITATNGYGTATLANCFTYLLPASGFNMPMMGI
jgi:hypothetical protein